MKICAGTETQLAACLQAGLFLDLFLDSEDGGEMFLWNVGNDLAD
jgi:hypothetical protein